MDRAEMLVEIERLINESRRSAGHDELVVDGDTELVGQIDSLDLASLILELEMITGEAPFADGLVPFHTAGDLADIYLDPGASAVGGDTQDERS